MAVAVEKRNVTDKPVASDKDIKDSQQLGDLLTELFKDYLYGPHSENLTAYCQAHGYNLSAGDFRQEILAVNATTLYVDHELSETLGTVDGGLYGELGAVIFNVSLFDVLEAADDFHDHTPIRLLIHVGLSVQAPGYIF